MTQYRFPRRALVTGAGGFLGKVLTARLDAAGWEVWGIGRSKTAGFSRKKGRYIRCDLFRASAPLKRIVAEVAPGAVIHLAAAVPGRAGANEWELVERNARMTAHLLAACEGIPRPPRVLLVSSSAVYGSGKPRGAISERHSLRPVNYYGVSKAMVEMLGSRAAAGGLPVICARLFNLIGPGQAGNFVVPAFMRVISSILGGKAPPEIRLATPSSARDFVDVRD
ncbi:MAG: NAD-dependent epimerase/dehydratase family protein, partial [bacterium]|nr:NAD-dependent epimerase/dehydratase family protein [bacterium]